MKDHDSPNDEVDKTKSAADEQSDLGLDPPHELPPAEEPREPVDVDALWRLAALQEAQQMRTFSVREMMIAMAITCGLATIIHNLNPAAAAALTGGISILFIVYTATGSRPRWMYVLLAMVIVLYVVLAIVAATKTTP